MKRSGKTNVVEISINDALEVIIQTILETDDEELVKRAAYKTLSMLVDVKMQTQNREEKENEEIV